jgi:hypothetical protein
MTRFYLQCLDKLDNRFAFYQNPKTLCEPKRLLKKRRTLLEPKQLLKRESILC